jgi:putative inorganic carbon (HCO3(-)) transporter
MLAPAALPAPLQAFIQNMLLVSSSSTAELRYEAWQRAWYMIQDFPITGIGMGSYKLVADIMYPTFVSAEALPHAHNLFLQVAVDLGLPGLLAWLTIVATAISATAHVIQHSRTPTNQYNLQSAQRTLAIGLLASQAALLIHGLVDAVVWGQVRLAPLVWLLFGLALGLQSARYTQQPDAQPHHSI